MTSEEKRKHNKKQNIISLAILVIGFIFIAAEGKALSKEKETKMTPMESQSGESQDNTWTLKQESVSQEMEFYGSLQAKKESDLSAKTSGRISSINVEEGDRVGTGQLLAYLLPDQNGINYDIASQNYSDFEKYRHDQASYWGEQVKIAEKDLEEKEEEKDYYEATDPAKVDMAEKNVDKAEETLKSTKRQRDAQKKSLKEQSNNYSGDSVLAAQYVTDTKVMAPYSGVITKKYLEAGEVVSAGQPIVTVADVSAYKVVIQVPDVLVNKLSIGQNAKVTLDGIDGEFGARVTRVNPKVDSVAKKIEVEITLNNIPSNAKTDMFARVILSFSEKSAYLVPDNFVFSDFTGPYVILADGKKQTIERISEKDGKTEIFFNGIASEIKIIRNINGREE